MENLNCLARADLTLRISRLGFAGGCWDVTVLVDSTLGAALGVVLDEALGVVLIAGLVDAAVTATCGEEEWGAWVWIAPVSLLSSRGQSMVLHLMNTQSTHTCRQLDIKVCTVEPQSITTLGKWVFMTTSWVTKTAEHYFIPFP